MSILDKHLDIRCPRCGKTSKLFRWDNATYSECDTDEMKELYTHLYEEKAFLRKTDAYYICPKCHNWSRGSQLKIIGSKDIKLNALGGEPIISFGALEEYTNDNKDANKN